MARRVLIVLSGLLSIIACAILWTDREELPLPSPLIPAEFPENRQTVQKTSDDFELPQSIQEDIWQAEHITFELEHRFGPRIKNAISSGNFIGVTDALRDGFLGAVVATDNDRIREHAGIEERLRVAADEQQDKLTGNEFIESFVADFSRLDTVDSTALRILRIFPESAEKWRAKVLVTAYGQADGGALMQIESTGEIVFEFTTVEHLETAAVVASWTEQKRVTRERSETFFEEVTEKWGLDALPIEDNWDLPPKSAVQYRFQMAVNDFDLDGRLDIAVATKHNSYLFHWDNEKTVFVDIGTSLGIKGRHTPATKPSGRLATTQMPTDLAGWIDINNDGFPDLVLGNRLYQNIEGKEFRDITSRSGLKWQVQSMGVEVADYDADGLLDLYILQQGTHSPGRSGSPLSWINDDEHGEPNRLWKNLGNGRFREVTSHAKAGAGKGHSLAATWFHYNNDRYPDLYIANDFSRNVLLKNRGDGTFKDVSQSSRSADFATSMGVAAGDVDNDGQSDLYVANMFSKMGRRIIAYVDSSDYPPGVYQQIQGSCAGNRLYFGSRPNGPFQEQGELLGVNGVGWAYAPAMADFDNDGWLDLYATTGFLSFQRQKPDG
jgi:hypothetical protein